MNTDARGHFSFQNLAPGRYQIRAVRSGYFASPRSGTLSVGAPTTVTANATVVVGQVTPEIVMTMLRGSTVSGRVLDPRGQPASGLQISAYQLAYQENGRWASLAPVDSRTTDDRGEYRLFSLPPGEYYIAVTPRRPRPEPSPQDAYAKTFFPGAVDARTVKAFTVAEGVDVTAVDFGIREGATTISGRGVRPLLDPYGQPSPRISSIILAPVDPKSLIDVETIMVSNLATNQDDGQFEIRGVLPGVYDLMAQTLDSAGRTIFARTRINVLDRTRDITLKFQPGIEVMARVTVDGAPPSFTMATQPAPRGGVLDSAVTEIVRAKLVSRVPQPITGAAAPVPRALEQPTPSIRLNWVSMGSFSLFVTSAANGNSTFDPTGVYRFPNVPEGRYSLQATGLPLNAYVANVQIRDMSVLDSGFDAGNVSGLIEVKVNSNGAQVQGTVLDGAKKPFASARVALLPEQARRQNINLYKTALSVAIGNFNFVAVAPGEYKLFAWEAVPNNAWMNEEFMAKYEAGGQTVTVSSDAPAKIELKLIPK